MYRKLDVDVLRHTDHLTRHQWWQYCGSYTVRFPSRSPWSLLHGLLEPPYSWKSVVGFAVAAGITLEDAVECLADVFSRAVPPPAGARLHASMRPVRRRSLIADAEF